MEKVHPSEEPEEGVGSYLHSLPPTQRLKERVDHGGQYHDEDQGCDTRILVEEDGVNLCALLQVFEGVLNFVVALIGMWHTP